MRFHVPFLSIFSIFFHFGMAIVVDTRLVLMQNNESTNNFLIVSNAHDLSEIKGENYSIASE